MSIFSLQGRRRYAWWRSLVNPLYGKKRSDWARSIRISRLMRHGEVHVGHPQRIAKPRMSDRFAVYQRERWCVAEQRTRALKAQCDLLVHFEGSALVGDFTLGQSRRVAVDCTIQQLFTRRRRLQDNAASLQRGAEQPSELPMIGIVRCQKKWHSRNNRKLWCFKEARRSACLLISFPAWAGWWADGRRAVGVPAWAVPIGCTWAQRGKGTVDVPAWTVLASRT